VADGRSVLVNFVYCHPVGHVIEALHYCHGYYRADPARASAWRCTPAPAST
jgi:hypothetical protein